MPTPLYGLPLYGDDDTAELDTLLNGQSTAIETALSTQFLPRSAMSFSSASSLPTSGNWPGRIASVTDTGSFYVNPAGDANWFILYSPKTTFTPTWTNLTVGPSTVSGWSRVNGGMCDASLSIVLASGFAMNASDVDFALPRTPVSTADGQQLGVAVYRKSGTGDYRGAVLLNSSGRGRLVWEPGGQAFFSGVKSSEPFAWGVDDSIRVQLRYAVE